MAMRGAPISELAGLGDKTLGKLREHGIESVEQLAQMTPEDLMQIPGVGEKTVERIRRVVTDYFERDQSGEGAPAEGAEAPVEVEETAETAEAPDAETPEAVAIEPTGEEDGALQTATEEEDKIEPADELETKEPEASDPEETGGGEK